MTDNIYKFENYPDRNFPVYMSVQQNRERLVSPHFHDDMEFILVQSGGITISVGMEKYRCHNHEILYIPPHTVHQAVSDTPDASLCGFVFHPFLIKSFLSEDDNMTSYTCRTGMVFSKGTSYYEEFFNVIMHAFSIYNARPSTYKLDMTARILLLLSLLLRSGAVINSQKKDRFCRIEPAINYIEENYNRKIRVSDLSRLVNVCDDHFIRMFKEAVSRTPTAYITDMRLHQALRLLSLNQYSISEISDRTGFSSIQYFSRIFKERIGLSPSEYAKIPDGKL